jgi:hypothetical protein
MKRVLSMAVSLLMVIALVGAWDVQAAGPPASGADSAAQSLTGIEGRVFVHEVTNPYFPLKPGTTMVYQGWEKDGNSRNVVEVTHDTRVVKGVTCVVLRDTVYVNGSLIEQTFDWYAQDSMGNVWYFGEYATEYDNGAVLNHEGSWEAGVDGAKAGIFMPGTLVKGKSYYQEYLKGVAEDQFKLAGWKKKITVAAGTYHNLLRTKEWSRLIKGVVENKFFAPGVGLVQSKTVKGAKEYQNLVSVQYTP